MLEGLYEGEIGMERFAMLTHVACHAPPDHITSLFNGLISYSGVAIPVLRKFLDA
jgi:hypothetical protein